jgi:iron complex outermembrane receptor protein
VSRGFRAPNIAELGANGRHEGTFRYEIGNPDLKAETSLQFDGGLGFSSNHVSGELSLFDNNISNFIFPEKLSSVFGGDSIIVDEGDAVPVYKFVQGNANLTGGEISIDIHPHPFDWVHFENSLSYVSSIQQNQPDSTKYLPFTPATKFTSELRGNFKKVNNLMHNAYVSVSVQHDFAKNNVYSAFSTETPTPAYTLLNAAIGTDFYSGNTKICSLIFIAANITDEAYQDHLSRLKYAPENSVTGRVGIFNMGRNFSIKLDIPIGIKK